jgi:hypothetical protein
MQSRTLGDDARQPMLGGGVQWQMLDHGRPNAQSIMDAQGGCLNASDQSRAITRGRLFTRIST